MKKWNGKLETVSKTPVKTREDLGYCLYSRCCGALQSNRPGQGSRLQIHHEGQHRCCCLRRKRGSWSWQHRSLYAAMPVMEGKAVLFKEFGNVNAVPICLDTQDTEEIIKAVTYLAPGFGGINLEDISAPRCFEIEERLKEILDIPGIP